jgi:O-antigen ligase
VLFILFIIFYFWQLIGIIYSENTKTGWNIFLSRLSLFLFPFVLIAPGERIIRNIKLLLKLFAGSTTIFILFCFAYAFLKSVSFQNGLIVYNPHPPEAYWTTYYYGSYFSVNQHPSYLSMYVILSLFIAFESWFDKNIKIRERVFWLIIGVFLLISIYFLSSRSGIIASIILVPLYFFYKLKQKRKRKGLVVVLSILVVLFALLLVIRSNERVKLVLNEISNGSLKQKAVQDGRVIIWRSALRIIRNNLILGVGIGDVRTELMKEYKEIGNQDLIENNYNVHNQFLEVLLENGLIGLILFLAILVYLFYVAICQQNLLSGLFIMMMLIFFMFESVLNRLAGITFFPLFSFLLLHLKSKTNN